jgi:pyridoxamine 5'-phosphate oxidase
MSELWPEIRSRFEEAFTMAKGVESIEPTAMVLATASADGRPSSRTVLLKSFGDDGFVFYTNLHSRKARQLAENPCASLTFFWKPLMQQVQTEGGVERVTDAEADAYWHTRARESQIGAWASDQSAALSSREELVERVRRAEERFPDVVPRPPHWSGFRLRPDRIEFWTSGTHRLHDRILYERGEQGWTMRRIFP